MTGRPCKPDDDFKRLWKTLMPGTPMPACGVAGDKEATAGEPPEPVQTSRDETKPPHGE